MTVGTAAGQIASIDADEPGEYLRNRARSRYDVIALRVEFQPDSSRFSTGDGTFNRTLFQGLEPRIDPFPHDASYFEAHLDFLENYIQHVSRQATRVETHLVPDVIRVSGRMRDYSPIGDDADSPTQRAKLAGLVAEAWERAGELETFQLPPGLDPNTTTFVIFHAGSGRDIELTGTTLDRTPEDLPSLFLDRQALDELVGRQILFKGMRVTSTALIPETESKRGVDPLSGEPFLLELSINGLLAASFFNYLGVPDLFDTSKGQSAIGPFGLMDPLGIFAYGGLLPPEPSGWTKYFLGWGFSKVLTGEGPSQIELRAGVDLALAPVSSSEYFLAEARHRDTESDGINLTVYRDGLLVEEHFEHDSDGFTSFDQSGFRGVLVSADDYDWALPGGFDTSGELRLGGILLWHVDDTQFRSGLEDNSVNTNPKWRALDLEEADSGQDLGHPSNNPFAPEFDRGTPFDFFFEGNPVAAVTETGEISLYRNRFASDTWPNSDTNANGPSFIQLGDFSPVSNTMSMTYRREINSRTRPIESLSGIRIGEVEVSVGSVSLITLDRGPAAVPTLLVQKGVDDLASLVVIGTGQVSLLPGVVGKPAVTATAGASKRVGYLLRDERGAVYFTTIALGQGAPQLVHPLPEEVRFREPSTPLIALDGRELPEYYVGYDLDGSGAIVRIDSSGMSTLVRTNGSVRSIAAVDGISVAIVEDNRATVWSGTEVVSEWTYPSQQSEIGQAVFGSDASGLVGVIPLSGSGGLLVLDAEGRTTELKTWSGVMSDTPVLADLDLDGFLDVLYATESTLEAMSLAGAVVAGFPIDLPDLVSGQPIVAVWEGEQVPSIVLGLQDGYIHGFSLSDGKERSGFPLAAGGGGVMTPLLSDSTLYAVSGDGNVAGWIISGVSEVLWSELFGSPDNASFALSAVDSPEPAQNSFLDEEETYNWPNPVKEGLTRIRVKTRERSEIHMTVVDMSGALVYETTLGFSAPGVPTEFEWRPEVASGVYLAKIEATGSSGETASALIRIAVVR